MILNDFCPNLCIYMDNSLVMFWEINSFTSSFLVKNAKNNVFGDKWFLSKMLSWDIISRFV